MDLIKTNTEKQRSVYSDHKYIRKYYYSKNMSWVLEHIKIMDIVMPGYIIGAGSTFQGVYVDMIVLPGIRADKFEHTDEFIKKIYTYCLELNRLTSPYYHGDWVLSNMFVDGDTIRMCDWDNVGKHSINEVNEKLYSDLYSAFGDKFKEIYDTATI